MHNTWSPSVPLAWVEIQCMDVPVRKRTSICQDQCSGSAIRPRRTAAQMTLAEVERVRRQHIDTVVDALWVGAETSPKLSHVPTESYISNHAGGRPRCTTSSFLAMCDTIPQLAAAQGQAIPVTPAAVYQCSSS